MRNLAIRASAALVCAVLMVGVTGCASKGDPRDPLEGMNRGTQAFNDGLDDYLIKPISTGYKWATPSFVDTGVTNFFSNIRDIGVTVNDLLQFKLKQGGMDGTRFLINTTLGVVGLIDVATMLDFEKHNEDFGQTLGAWGVPTGPYLVLPLLGPSSPRGTTGLIGDAALNPITYVGAFPISIGLFSIGSLDESADLLPARKIVDQAPDRYEFIRDAYLQRREHLVRDGNMPIEDEEDLFLLEEEAEQSDEATATVVKTSAEQSSGESAGTEQEGEASKGFLRLESEPAE